MRQFVNRRGSSTRLPSYFVFRKKSLYSKSLRYLLLDNIPQIRIEKRVQTYELFMGLTRLCFCCETTRGTF